MFLSRDDPAAEERVRRALIELRAVRGLAAVSAEEARRDLHCVLPDADEDTGLPRSSWSRGRPRSAPFVATLGRARGVADVKEAVLRHSDLALALALTTDGADHVLLGGDCPAVGQRIR